MQVIGYQIFLNFMKGLSLQVATVVILLDAVLAMLLSIGTKYETKKLIAISSLFVNDFAQRTYKFNSFSFFFTTDFAKLNCLTA